MYPIAKMACGLLICLLLLVSKSAIANNDVLIAQGFVSGASWLAMEKVQKRLYTVGVVDGMKFSPLLSLGNDHSRTDKLVACVAPMSIEQIYAIVEARVKAKPENWHQAVHYEIFGAITEVCRIFK